MTENTDPITLTVEGMTCEHCQVTVDEALRRAGLGQHESDWRRGTARGLPSREFTAQRAAEELESVGYRLTTMDDGETRPAENASDL